MAGLALGQIVLLDEASGAGRQPDGDVRCACERREAGFVAARVAEGVTAFGNPARVRVEVYSAHSLRF